MDPAASLTALARGAARRPKRTLVIAGLLALLGLGLALSLRPSTATDTLVPRSSQTFKATERYHRQFGDEAVVVLVREPLTTLLHGRDIDALIGLESCLSGVRPRTTPRGGIHGPCAQITSQHATHLVFGPGTFLAAAASELGNQLLKQYGQVSQSARQDALTVYQQARTHGRSKTQATQLAQGTAQLEQSNFTRSLFAVAKQYGLSSLPDVHDQNFVGRIVFDRSSGEPKARFSSLFPSAGSAIIQVRLRPDLSTPARDHAIKLIRQAVRMADWRLSGGDYVVTGVPVIVSDLSGSISSSLSLLLLGALAVMGLVLALIFRGRPRLLPLLISLLAAAYTFGLLSLSGAPLTMASIGVLPVLIGLAVDYAIQFHSRVEEEPARLPELAAARAAALGGPAIAVACAATAGGFLVLALPGVGSPVPMVRDFGLLLLVGVLIALACTFTVVPAALALAGRHRPRAAAPALLSRLGLLAAVRGAGALLAERRPARGSLAAVRGAGELLRDRTARPRLGMLLTGSLAGPERALAIALVLALCGWGLGTRLGVESDVQKLVPQSLPALQDLGRLQQSTHVGGEIDVLVHAADLTDPRVFSWMTGYQARVESRFGGLACGQAQICPAFSLPDLFQGQGSQASLSQGDIRGLLDAVPPYFAQGVISPDRRTASLAFGIRLMALSQQKRVIDALRADLRTPPGVSAELVGLPVLVADANAQIASPWRRLGSLLAGLGAVALVLLLALRSLRRALIPLLPIALATGWSSLLLWLFGVTLNPMSVTLGALVIAISTEFSVLLSERYRQERADGLAVGAALERTYESTGRAVLASGITAIAGFGVLALSDISMLRNFGLATVVDLAVSLLGVLLILPAVLLLSERAWPVTLRLRAAAPAR